MVNVSRLSTNFPQYAILFIPSAKVQDSTAVGKLPFPSKSFAIHYALIVPWALCSLRYCQFHKWHKLIERQ
jgi:hypothetical protein